MDTLRADANETLTWIDIPKSGGLKIKAILQGSFDQPVAIAVHGKPGWPDGYEHTRTGEYLNERAITFLRLYMYSEDSATRALDGCDLRTYTSDFETAVAYVKAHGAPAVFGIGHSYGGLAILNSTAKLDGAVLLDPTHGSFWTEYPGVSHDPSAPSSEYEALGDTTGLAAGKGYPLQIISAGKGKMVAYHDRYMAIADEPKSHVTIPKAHHNLADSLEIVDKVRALTYQWLAECLGRSDA